MFIYISRFNKKDVFSFFFVAGGGGGVHISGPLLIAVKKVSSNSSSSSKLFHATRVYCVGEMTAKHFIASSTKL